MARGENCLIAVAGAATAVTNSSIAGILDEIGEGSEIVEIYGAIAGLPGVLEGKITDLGAQKRTTIEGLRRTPGSVLAGRHRLMQDADGAALIAALREREIGTLFLLGGLPAIGLAQFATKAAADASYELSVLVVPISAQNEVEAGDHNVGYGSAARFAAQTVRDAERAASGGEEPIVVLEMGGQNAGWLPAASALARDEQNSAPHAILLPEIAVDTENMLGDVRRATQKYGYAVAVTSQGAKDTEGNSLDGASLANLLQEKLGLPVRLDLLGTSATVSSVNLSRADNDEAYGLAGLAVRLADDGCSGYVVALNRDPNAEGKGERGYRVIESSAHLAETSTEPRKMPMEFLGEGGVSAAFVDWLKPLVSGPLTEYSSLS